MSNYDPENFKPGEMDISTQSETFDGFMRTCVIVTACTAAVCIFLLIVGT